MNKKAEARRWVGIGALVRRLVEVEGAAIAVVFILLVIMFCFAAPRAFLGYRLYMSFMASAPPPMIIALGLTLVVVAGEMDLSFPSIVAFSSYVFSMLYQSYDLTWSAFAAALAAGTVLGLANGLIITQLGYPVADRDARDAVPLGRADHGGVERHISRHPADRRNGYSDHLRRPHRRLPGADALGSRRQPCSSGTSSTAIGSAKASCSSATMRKVAKVVGIATDREKIKLFTLMGFLSAFAGVLLTLETTSYFSSQGMGYLLVVVASVFIGGTSIFGGSGKVVGTVFGSLIVAIIEAGLVASGIQGFWTRFFIGVVFIVSVTMNAAIEDPDKVPLLKRLRARARN